MNPKPRTLDVSHLPDFDISNNSPLWWGQLLMAIIEASMFFMMIGIYFYLRLSVDMWPPPGTQIPHVTWPTIALVCLLASAWGSWYASEGAKQDSRRKMLIGLIVNLILAVAFLGLRLRELTTINFNWATDVHGTVWWSIVYLHSLDAIGDMLFTVVLIVIIALGRYAEKQRLGVHVDSVVWYFIVLIWIPFYAVVYWGPYFVGAPR